MRKVLFVLFLAVFLIGFFGFNWQKPQAQETGDGFQKLEILAEFPRPIKIVQPVPSSLIKDIRVFGEKSGIAFTNETLFRTDDGGETWREIPLPRDFGESLSAVIFLNENRGRAILGDGKNARLELAKT